MTDYRKKLEDKDNSIKLNSSYPEKPFDQIRADIDRLEKLIYFLAEELSK